ncbi:hypothetical protein Bpfe_012352, partial [Biomphalaria pfeifferi]
MRYWQLVASFNITTVLNNPIGGVVSLYPQTRFIPGGRAVQLQFYYSLCLGLSNKAVQEEGLSHAKQLPPSRPPHAIELLGT